MPPGKSEWLNPQAEPERQAKHIRALGHRNERPLLLLSPLSAQPPLLLIHPGKSYASLATWFTSHHFSVGLHKGIPPSHLLP